MSAPVERRHREAVVLAKYPGQPLPPLENMHPEVRAWIETGAVTTNVMSEAWPLVLDNQVWAQSLADFESAGAAAECAKVVQRLRQVAEATDSQAILAVAKYLEDRGHDWPFPSQAQHGAAIEPPTCLRCESQTGGPAGPVGANSP